MPLVIKSSLWFWSVTSQLDFFHSSWDADNPHLTQRLRPTIAVVAADENLRCSDLACNVLGRHPSDAESVNDRQC